MPRNKRTDVFFKTTIHNTLKTQDEANKIKIMSTNWPAKLITFTDVVAFAVAFVSENIADVDAAQRTLTDGRG